MLNPIKFLYAIAIWLAVGWAKNAPPLTAGEYISVGLLDADKCLLYSLPAMEFAVAYSDGTVADTTAQGKNLWLNRIRMAYRVASGRVQVQSVTKGDIKHHDAKKGK